MKNSLAKLRAHELTATEAVQQISHENISREDYLRDCIEYIRSREQTIGAWTHLDVDAAIVRARTLDRIGDSGVLTGIPFAIKDIIDTAEMPTGYGSEIYTGSRPCSDAACVALTRRAGGIALGKSVSTEFANVHPGKTRNPFDALRTPGGSSSGSAAAVGAMMVPLAIGTQTTASTIRPASYCGVYGFIPTQGKISCSGIRQASWTMDRIGLFARSVDDIALFNDVVRGALPAPLITRQRTPRIAFCRTHLWERVEPGTVKLLEAAARDLAILGATVIDLDLPAHFANIVEAHRSISSFEFTKNFAYEMDHHFDRISPALRNGRIADGQNCSIDNYEEALRFVADCRADLDEMFEGFDAIMTVGAAGEAPVGTATGEYIFCALWTALHVPCITVPAFKGPNGLPIGLQLVGRRGADRNVLSVAKWVADSLEVS